jgi:hypothetical protein
MRPWPTDAAVDADTRLSRLSLRPTGSSCSTARPSRWTLPSATGVFRASRTTGFGGIACNGPTVGPRRKSRQAESKTRQDEHVTLPHPSLPCQLHLRLSPSRCWQTNPGGGPSCDVGSGGGKAAACSCQTSMTWIFRGPLRAITSAVPSGALPSLHPLSCPARLLLLIDCPPSRKC